MNISIAIADTNERYVERLVEGLQEYDDLLVSVFSDAELLEQALSSKKYDVVVFDPDISEDRLVFPNTNLSICLYSEEAQNIGLYADVKKIVKYQRISRLYKEIIKLYADAAGYATGFDKIRSTKLIGVYSPIGGSGKTTIALALAYKFASYGKRVLFISLEQMNSASVLYPHTEEGITMLVEMLEENINFELKLKGIIKEGLYGISYIEGFERIVDYNIVSREEISKVINQLRKYSDFDMVILDLGTSMDNIVQAVFERADDIVIVEKDGELAEKKLELFTQQAIVCEYITKMCRVVNFAEGNSKNESKLEAPYIGSVRNYGSFSIQNMIKMIGSTEEINISTWIK